MRILLVGEYNRSHHFLKEGLKQLGHEAVVVGLNDGFKKVPVDITIKQNYNTGIKKKIRIALFKLLSIDLQSHNIYKQIKKHEQLLSGYDIVQYINESPFICTPKTEIKIFNFLKERNKNFFLLSCGTDYVSVKYAYDKKFKYSILTPYFEGKIQAKNFSSVLKHLEPSFIKLHQYLYKHIKGVIASDLDYHLPLKEHPKYLGMVPNPIKLSDFKFTPAIVKDKVIIFHGINQNNYFKKGNDLFELALAIIKEKYPEKTHIKTVKNLPYKEYIKSYNQAHILLDQVYAYDQGFNALEAMAMGKVVFTGAEKEWLDYYNLTEDTIAINAKPDVNALVNKLEWLILNPEKITEISYNTRNFIEKEHNYIHSAQDYLNKWLSQL